MQFRVDAEIQALTRDLQALAMDHRIVVCTSNRPFAIAMATSFAWASASHPGQLLGICTHRLHWPGLSWLRRCSLSRRRWHQP